MAAVLPRPGVEVIQEFRTVSPTVITPTLVPCITAVAKQLVEVLEGGALNPSALVSLPGLFIAKAAPGTPPVYAGLDGLVLAFTVNGGGEVQVAFSDPLATGLTPATVVSQVNSKLASEGVSSARAETIGTDRWQLYTVGLGDFESLVVTDNTDPAVLSAFGIGIGKTYAGVGGYNQYALTIPPTALPDPRGNLSELGVELATIRVFLATAGSGTGLFELKRDEAFLRAGEVDFSAQVTGSADLSMVNYPMDVQGDTLTLRINGANQSHTVTNPGDLAAFLAELNASFTGVTFTVTGGNELVITTAKTGADASVRVMGGSLLADIGLTVGDEDAGENIEAVDDGNGDAFTSLLHFRGQDFTATATAAVLSGADPVDWAALAAGDTLVLSDGGLPQTIEFDGTEASLNDVLDKINNVMAPAAGGKITATDAGGGELLLTHSELGEQSIVYIVGGSALAKLDPAAQPTLIAGALVTGNPHPPLPGDELYLDGSFFATVSQVAPGGDVTMLKVNRHITISKKTGARFYIQAKNLPAAGSPTRPYPDLRVDLAGNVQLKHRVLRDPFGAAALVPAPLYLSYRAVRRDVSALAKDPGLLTFSGVTELQRALSPLSVENPLGLGLFFALLNAAGAQVTGLGVDEVSDDAPFGTVEAFTRAAEYLESFEVYAIAPMTHDMSVAQVFNSHVSLMSEADQKGERIVIFNPSVPSRRLDKLVASGTKGDGLTNITFDTKVAALSSLLQAAGVSPLGVIPASAGVYLDVASDGKNYSVESITGSVVTIRTSFDPGDNDDSFYSTSSLALPLVNETFAIRIRGSELLDAAGRPDKQAIAETMQALGQGFLNRRLWMTFPDRCAATLEGIEQVIDGFYMNAAIAGMIAGQPPQQSFTNFPMTGFTRVLGSNDTFSERQLDMMAAGGTYIIVQDSPSAPLVGRMALTTDMTSIEQRTDSITKVVDFTAKFLRRALRNFIGRFNITQGFLDSVGSVIQGLLGFLVETGVLVGANLTNIIQDEDQPDSVMVTVTLDVPFPCNYLRLTLAV